MVQAVNLSGQREQRIVFEVGHQRGVLDVNPEGL